MPTYQYACTQCSHRFDVVQSFVDDPLRQCPVCQGQLRKVISAVGVVFKGSGFYRNDSRTAAQKSSGDGDSGGTGATPEKKSETKADSPASTPAKSASSTAATPA